MRDSIERFVYQAQRGEATPVHQPRSDPIPLTGAKPMRRERGSDLSPALMRGSSKRQPPSVGPSEPARRARLRKARTVIGAQFLGTFRHAMAFVLYVTVTSISLHFVKMPRINFFSITFLFAFGLGSFVGIGLALLAVALARPADTTTVIEATQVVAADRTTATATATLVPTETPTPVPVVRALTTLQVHIGPDDAYAVLGTLASGSENRPPGPR